MNAVAPLSYHRFVSTNGAQFPATQINTQIMSVTPELARQWLEKNDRNRPLHPPTVRRYADDMRAGRWKLTHQGIAFSPRGILIDGQHRLSAIIECGLTISMMVTFNADAETVLAVDQNNPRKPSQQFTLMGDLGSVGERQVAVLRMMIPGLQYTGRKRSVSEEYDLMKKHQEAIAFSFDIAPATRTLLTVASVRAVWARAYYSADLERVREFAKSLVTGVSPSSNGDCVSMLARFLLEQKRGASDACGKVRAYARATTALYSFLTNQNLKRLKPADREYFPLPE